MGRARAIEHKAKAWLPHRLVQVVSEVDDSHGEHARVTETLDAA